MINLISLNCPDCGAQLSIESERKYCFCQYCGKKILIDDGSTIHTYHEIDEAKIKEVETNAAVRMKEMEIEERKWMRKQRQKVSKIFFSILGAIIGMVLLLLGCSLDITGIALVGSFIFLIVMWTGIN